MRRESVERKCTDKVSGHAPASHVPVSRTQHAWLQGSIRTMEGMPRNSTLSPPTCAFLLLRRSASCSCLPCLASPRQIPYVYQQGRLSGCLDPAPSVCDLPSRFVVRDHRSTQGSTTVLAAYQSVNQRGQPVPQPTSRPKVAKVGNGTTRFGLLFGRGTVSPRLPAVCTPSCSSPDWK